MLPSSTERGRQRLRRLFWMLILVIAFFTATLGIELAAYALGIPLLVRTFLVQASLLAIALLIAQSDGDGLHNLGLFRLWKGSDAGLIAAILVVHWGGSVLVGLLWAHSGESDLEGKAITGLFESFVAMEPGTFILIALGLALAAGLSEEILFRGYLITRLERLGLSAWSCILLSALIFGLVHWPGYGFLPAISKAVWFGIPTGIYFWYRRNLGPVIVAHALIDFLGFMLAYVIFKYMPNLPMFQA